MDTAEVGVKLDTGDEPDSITPVEGKSFGAFGALMRRLFPTLAHDTRSGHRKAYRSYPSFTDMLPYIDYLPNRKQILFDDCVSRMGGWEIEPIPTEGRSQAHLGRQVQAIQQLLTDSCDEHDVNPWVIQVYAIPQDITADFMKKKRAYVRKAAEGSRYSERYLGDLEAHLRDVAAPEGYFYDSEVSDSNFRLQSFKIMAVVYRKYTSGKPSEDPADELEATMDSFESNLKTIGVKYRRLTGADYHSWLSGWLNPRPEICGRDPSRLGEVLPYPGDSDIPFGRDFASGLTLSAPRIDKKRKVWYIDGMPHAVIQTLQPHGKIKVGQLTGEIDTSINSSLEKDGAVSKRFALVDRLPQGTVIAMTVIVEPQSRTKGQIELVRDKAWGHSGDAAATRDEAKKVLDRMNETRDKVYPCELAFYVRGENYKKLRRNVGDTRSLLSSNGVLTIDPWIDKVQIDHFRRNLPGVYRADLERTATRRARLFFTKDIAALLPFYGRSRGTDGHAFTFLNRSGEPVSFDPLSKKDRRKNAHMLVYGPTGAGKSATLTSMIQDIMAIHRPRMFIFEMGDSFGLLGKFLASNGVSVNRMRITPTSNVSFPPFANITKILDEDEEPMDLDDDDDLDDDLEAFGGTDDDEDLGKEEKPDYMAQAQLVVEIMAAGEKIDETSGLRRFSPSEKIVIRKSILKAARNVRDGKTKHDIALSEDVAAAMKEVGAEEAYEDMRPAIREMADAILLFCSGHEGRLFNRPGTVLPEVDVTIIDLAAASQDGREDMLAILYISVLMEITRIGERDQYKERQMIALTDEGHLVLKHPQIAPITLKATKMWRKLGIWYWLATQKIDDFSGTSQKMLDMMEWWIGLGLEKKEIEKTNEYKALDAEESAMIAQCAKQPGSYVEAVVLGPFKTLLRIVPPPINFILSQTEKHEKVARRETMRKHGVTELKAVEILAEELRVERRRAIADAA